MIPAERRADVPYALNLARATLRRVAPPALPDADWEDFEQVAALAALRALITYQPERLTRWQSWIIAQVRFALLDELRRLDHLKQADRRRARATGAALPPRPTSLDWLLSLEDEVETHALPCLPVTHDDHEPFLLRETLRPALERLPPRLAYIARRLAEGALQKQIAAELSLSTTRIRQLMAEIKAELTPLLED